HHVAGAAVGDVVEEVDSARQRLAVEVRVTIAGAHAAELGVEHDDGALGEVEVGEVDGGGLDGDGADLGGEADAGQLDQGGGSDINIFPGGNREGGGAG